MKINTMNSTITLTCLCLVLLLFAPDMYGQTNLDEIYRQREVRGNAEVKEQLHQLRTKAKSEKWTFELGFTQAMERKMDQFSNLRAPSNWRQEAQDQNKRLNQNMQLKKQHSFHWKCNCFVWVSHSKKARPARFGYHYPHSRPKNLRKLLGFQFFGCCGSQLSLSQQN